MSKREDAIRAANFLNSGEKYRALNCAADWPEHREQGRWYMTRWKSTGGWDEYYTDAQLIELAKSEGWEA